MPRGKMGFNFRGSMDAKISVELTAGRRLPLDAQTTTEVVSVADLLASRRLAFDAATATDPSWSIARINTDVLRIDLGETPLQAGEHGVASISQAIKLTARANGLLAERSAKLVVSYEIHQVATGRVVASDTVDLKTDQNGNSAPVTLTEKPIADAGVYELHCQLSQDDKIWTRLRRSEPIVETFTPFVVVPEKIASSGDTWKVVGNIQPAQRPEWEIKQWLPGTPDNRTNSAGGLQQANHDGKVVSILAPNSTYATALPKLQQGWPHKITLRYPAAQRVRIRVELSDSKRFTNSRQSLMVKDLPVIGSEEAWREQTFLHYPTAGEQFVRLTNTSDQQIVSFSSLKIEKGPYQVTGPDADADKRQRLAVLRISNFDWVNSLSDDATSRGQFKSYQKSTQQLQRLYVATERLRDYARMGGFNSILLPGNMGERFWYPTNQCNPGQVDGLDLRGNLQTFMQLLAISRLQVIVGVDPKTSLTSVESLLKAPGTPTASICRFGTVERGTRYKLLHPAVRSAVAAWITDLESQLAAYPSYAGIAVSCGNDSHTALVQASDLNDESSQRTFARTVSSEVATFDALHLKLWLADEGADLLPAWCDQQTQAALQQLAAATNKELFVVDAAQSELPRIADSISNLTAVVNPASSPSQTESYPPTRFAHDPKLVHAVSIGELQQQDNLPELHSPQSNSELTQLLRQFDPRISVFQQPQVTTSWCQELATALNEFTRLPAQGLSQVIGSDPGLKTVSIRSGYQDGEALLVVLNSAPWSSEVDILCDQSLDWVPNTNQANLTIQGTEINATLRPDQMLVLRAPASNQTAATNLVRVWSARVQGGEESLTEIKEQVTAVVERIGSLANPRQYAALCNGGFEQVGGLGIPGWMHAQHPAGAVKVDEREAVEGSRSVMLTTDNRGAGRTWIVSEQLRPPSSGRLAVSLACRGELVEGDTTKHVIRISIEGTRKGEPIRQSREFQINRDGLWQPRSVVLEAAGIDPTTVDSVRLTIDSLSPGRVWLDDVRLHDWFPMAHERGELQSEAFLAMQGLQHENLTPAAQLLQNQWAQHLLSKKPLHVQPPSQPNMQPISPRLESRGVAERIKSWLPRPLRF